VRHFSLAARFQASCPLLTHIGRAPLPYIVASVRDDRDGRKETISQL
jgi:hypothetical protein